MREKFKYFKKLKDINQYFFLSNETNLVIFKHCASLARLEKGAGKLSLIKVCNEGHFGRLDAASRTGCQMAASSHTAVTVNTKKLA